MVKIVALGVILQILGTYSFIIPDELPSILSVIYSNIPTVKKGTDSRIGWGFRLGNRADIQFLTELGPQTNTQPLVNQPERTDGGSFKRSNLDSLSNTLYAQRQKDKQLKKEAETAQISKSEGSQWLQTWSKTMKKITSKNNHQENQKTVKMTPEPQIQIQQQKIPKNAKPGISIGEIDAKSVFPEEPEDDIPNSVPLSELYKNKDPGYTQSKKTDPKNELDTKNTTINNKRESKSSKDLIKTDETIKVIKEKIEKPLDDVSIDDDEV